MTAAAWAPLGLPAAPSNSMSLALQQAKSQNGPRPGSKISKMTGTCDTSLQSNIS